MSATDSEGEIPMKPLGIFDGAELRLLDSGRFSDCQVSIGPRTWNLHKFIICDRSTYFDRALCGNFVEAADNKVVISESNMNEDYFGWIVHWLYSGGYPLEIAGKANSLAAAVRYFIYADYLGIECLSKELSNSVAEYTTELNAEPPTTQAHKNTPSDWVEAMRVYYETFRGEEKHGLKSALFDLCLLNRKLKEQVFELEKLKDLIIDMPAFCQDLMLETVRRKL